MACETRFLWNFFAASSVRGQPSGLPSACRPTAIDGPGTHAPSPRPLSISMPVVVGLHGGALAHAIFLGPGQGLVEITPREHSCGHPSMFAHMAVGVGATYAGVLCRTCSMARGGAVDVEAVVRVVREVLQNLHT